MMIDRERINVTNPMTGELVGTISKATKEDVDHVLAASKEGLKKWSAVALKDKEKIFENFFRLMEEHKREIIGTLMRESGSSIRNGLFQWQGIAGLFRGYLETAKRYEDRLLVPGTEPGHDGKTEKDLQMVIHEPVGTVLAIVPFNAPLMLFGYKVAPALAAGNAVIVKPPTSNPLALIKMIELLWEAGVPKDALQVITGEGGEIGNWLVQDSRINAVTLTGSTEVGLHIAGIMAKRLAPCALELGGNDPFIVLEDADVDIAAREAAFWRMNSAGQVCIAPKRFIIQNSVKDYFIKKVVEFVDNIKMGYDLDVEAELDMYADKNFADLKPSQMKMNCLISEKAAIRVEKQIIHTVEQGARILTGGVRKGAFIKPTVLVDVTREMDVSKDMEIFGPVMPIIGFDNEQEAIDIANSSCFGLSGCVMTKDWKKGMNIARKIESGGVVVNGVGTYRNMAQPFGGMKLSGMGKEGFSTLAEVVTEKVIILKGFLE